jgi:hypothetical protein
MLFNLTLEDKTKIVGCVTEISPLDSDWVQLTWGDMSHVVKKSERESNSSKKYLILCVLVVMKNPTSSQIMILKALLFISDWKWNLNILAWINLLRNYPNGTVEVPCLLENYLYCTKNCYAPCTLCILINCLFHTVIMLIKLCCLKLYVVLLSKLKII